MQTAIIRPKQAAAMFGVSLSTVWNWNNPKHKQFRPDFPKPIKVSANATGWLQSELEGYLQKLADNRQGGLTMRKRHSAIPSQTERILAVLQNGKTLTAHDMHQMGIMQCNTRILELQRAGHQIVCIMEQVENQYGQTVRRGRYLLASTKAV